MARTGTCRRSDNIQITLKMNKTININLAGIIFYVDEDAYQHFNDYLSAVRKQFSNAEERAEIIADIEARIAELLQQKLTSGKQVINRADIDEVISIMGSPEDYAVDEDEEKTAGTSTNSASAKANATYAGPKRLFRNPDDKILGGVSGGLAAYFGIDAIWIRLVWVALFFGLGTGFLFYIILWIVMPEAKTTAQKLQMRGEPINIGNIERTVKEEMRDVKERFENYRKDGKFKNTGSSIRNTLEEIVTAVLSVARYALLFALKFIGGILMVAGVIVLIVLFSLFLGNNFHIQGALVDWGIISDYLNALMPSSGFTFLLVVGGILLALAPIIGLILLGMRILFNYRPQFTYVSASLAIVSIIGVIFIVISGISLGREFSREAAYNEVIELGSAHKSYALRVAEYLDDERPIDLDWTITEKAQLLGFVTVDIRKTDQADPYMEIICESHGLTRLDARKRAKRFTFFNELQDSIISVGDYFTIPFDEKFRGQNLEVALYLPVGHSVYLDESTIDLLHDIENVTNTWEGNMVAHTWVMTQNGLACMDCTGDEDTEWRDAEEWNDFESEFETEAKAFEKEALRAAEDEIENLKKEIEQLKKKKK